MLLVHTQKITTRLTYSFKHILFRVLGCDVSFTTSLEEFVSYSGAKMSYGKQPLSTELFVQEFGLLSQNGIEAIDILVKPWEEVPAFFSTSEKSCIPFDIFSAAFYLLSRYEEYLPHVKDEKGRYPAHESLAAEHNFLELPVIDIWAYKFKAVLATTYPKLHFSPKQMKVHTLLSVQQPFQYNQKGLFRSALGYLQDLTSGNFKEMGQRTQVLLGMRKDSFDTFTWIVNISKRSSAKLTAFFLLGEHETYEASLNTHRKAFKELVKYVGDYTEIGLLYSGSSLERYETLQAEKKRIEAITNRSLISAKQANFHVNLPENYRNLIELEIVKDYTMAYHDAPGFRAGTCTPFLFYDLDFEIKTPLMLHPVSVTSTGLGHLQKQEIEETVTQLMQRVKEVNGVFSMVFNNRDFTSAPEHTLWRKLFSETLQNNG
ncbi:polysaccharide deacetylase family protein [Marinirhabdus gelatinilytica]|uniref:DUF7033 domain-containing protein n=1 Tax=Marinirhabdus gelatinilytica TaxID=1703343 RepID=A0A370QLK2_9FLAO|nr:polysaccharide deacetylase family protein [Marinirhabdus gelatinilytica]RDK89257.1 hypothetical protein C8D94_1011143 [Marinirhabdus gelatinilytica]